MTTGTARLLPRRESRRAYDPYRPSKRSTTSAWLVLSSIAVIGGAAAAASSGDPLTLMLVAGLAVAALPFVLPLTGRRFDLFEPSVIVSLSFLPLFVVRPYYELTAGTTSQGFLDQDYRPGLVKALAVAVVGLCSFFIAYYLGPGRSWGRMWAVPSRDWDPDRTIVLTSRLFAVSLAAFGLFIMAGGGWPYLKLFFSGRSSELATSLSSSSGYLYTAPDWCVGLGLVLLLLSTSKLSRASVLGTLLLLYGLILKIGPGNRASMLPIAAALLITLCLKKEKRPGVAGLAVALTVAFFFGISLPREYRTSGSLQESIEQVVRQPHRMFDELFLGADTAMVDSLASEVRVVPEVVPYQKGATYLEALGRPIPRAVWPSKPLPPEAILMNALYPNDYSRGTGFSFSIFGEPWLNGGWIAVIAVLAASGTLLRALWEWFQANSDNKFAMVVFAVGVSYIFVYFRGGLGVDYQRQVLTIFPILLVYKLQARPIRDS